MSVTRKILLLTILLFSLITLFCYVGFCLGYNGLILIGEIEVPKFINDIIKTAFYLIQTFLLISFCLDCYKLKSLLPLFLIFSVVYLISGFIFNFAILYISNTLPLLIVLVVSIKNKHFKKSLKRLFVLNLSILIYQYLVLIVKVGCFEFCYNALTVYQGWMISIDMIILIIIFWLIGGEKNYALAFEYVVFPEDVGVVQEDIEDGLVQKEWAELQGYKLCKAIMLLFGFQLLQWLIVLLVCWIGNVFIEGVIITVAFVAYGFVIKNKWHSNSIVLCSALATVIFYAAAKITIAFKYSQFFSIFIGLILIYMFYRLGVMVNQKNKKELEIKNRKLDVLQREVDVMQKQIDNMSEIL